MTFATQDISAYTVAIVSLYEQGVPGTKIARDLGVSRQAVHKHIKRAGLTRRDGGACTRRRAIVELKAARVAANREARTQAQWGCSYSEYVAHRDAGTIAKYGRQRKHAQQCGNRFELTFAEWLHIAANRSAA